MTLSIDRLRQALYPRPVSHFTDEPALASARTAHASDLTPTQMRDAAVLVPIVARQSGWNIVLTRRTQHLRNHAGQISFPGGAAETDDGGAAVTAIREANEEIGVDPEQIELLGFLAEHPVITGFSVTPVVALLASEARFLADPNEVDEVFEVPWAFVTDRQQHQLHSRQVNGHARQTYRLRYQSYDIWGATAGMLVDLARTYRRGDR